VEKQTGGKGSKVGRTPPQTELAKKEERSMIHRKGAFGGTELEKYDLGNDMGGKKTQRDERLNQRPASWDQSSAPI